MQSGVVIRNFEAVIDDMAVDIFARRRSADLPAWRQFNRHVLEFFVRVFDVDWVYAFGMLEQMLFDCRENGRGNDGSTSSARCPIGDTHIQFGHQWRFGTAPIGLARESYFAGSRNQILDSVLDESFSSYIVRVPDTEPVIHRLQSRVCD